MGDSNTPDKQVNTGRFQKGVSGNPKGRPKLGYSLTEEIRKIGDIIEPKTGKAYRELFSHRIWRDAINGNTTAQTTILNRLEGMPSQKIEGLGNAQFNQFNFFSVNREQQSKFNAKFEGLINEAYSD